MSEVHGGAPYGSNQPTPVTTPRHEDKPKTGWFVGLILIGIGIVFLLENFGWVFSENWWAAFIYIAAGGAFVNMWRQWKIAGWFDSKAAGSLTGGLLLATVASIFLFNLEWDFWWPLVLVAIGAGIVLGWVLGAATEKSRTG